MITTSFNQKEKRLEVKYIGEITAEEIIDFIVNEVGENIELPRDLKILSDARLARFNFSTDQVARITECMQQYIPKFQCVCDAFVTQTALETGLTMVYGQSMSKVINHYLEVFSTKSAALAWLDKHLARV
jgi:hypothetical protein